MSNIIETSLIKKFDSYFKFTFVRNPYDRLFSAYTFLKKGGINDQDNNFAKKYLSEYNSFDNFVKFGLIKPEVLSWVHFKPQKDFYVIQMARLLLIL